MTGRLGVTNPSPLMLLSLHPLVETSGFEHQWRCFTYFVDSVGNLGRFWCPVAPSGFPADGFQVNDLDPLGWLYGCRQAGTDVQDRPCDRLWVGGDGRADRRSLHLALLRGERFIRRTPGVYFGSGVLSWHQKHKIPGSGWKSPGGHLWRRTRGCRMHPLQQGHLLGYFCWYSYCYSCSCSCYCFWHVDRRSDLNDKLSPFLTFCGRIDQWRPPSTKNHLNVSSTANFSFKKHTKVTAAISFVKLIYIFMLNCQYNKKKLVKNLPLGSMSTKIGIASGQDARENCA